MQNVTTPVAPAHPLGTGTQQRGGHHYAAKAQPAFAPTATLSFVSAVNPWRVNSHGHRFYAAVLAAQPTTIAAALAAGAKVGFTAPQCQAHLRWLYTWGGSYIAVNGVTYSNVAPVAPVAAPVIATPKKGKGKKAA